MSKELDEKLDKVDHKKIGADLELFFSHELAPGAPFWLPKGMIVFKELEKYIRELTLKAEYQEISTPIMIKSDIFKQSGHWEKFGKHNMYNLSIWEDEEIKKFQAENKTPPVNYSLKPMNCPESTVVYRFRPRSYRELPLRLSEIGRLHRREKSGEVNGLLRVRQITMDDAHIFARDDQIEAEISNILDTMSEFYDSFGFEYEFKLATRPEQFAGTIENWEKAEKMLESILKSKKLKYSVKPKDGAFYGPKIDLHINDSLGREWQLATVQLDFHQPKAFNLTYTDEKGEQKTPAMIHRAIFGSFERFIGILTEHFTGAFPAWLSPVQVKVLPVSDKVGEYAQKVSGDLSKSLRTEYDDRNEKLGAKIRDAQLQKVPYMVIIGQKEQESGKIALRLRDGRDLGQMKLSEFIEKSSRIVESKSLELW